MTTAWIAGASGLVGTELLRLLLADRDFTKVHSFGRRTLAAAAPKLEQTTVDFADPSSFQAKDAVDVAFSCLGTTIKKAGSPGAFRAVDHDAVLTFAKAARDRGARVFVHVTSLGADARSRQLYTSVKGEVELALQKVGFTSVYALRPSILDGDRQERRTFERVGLVVARALAPVLGKYRPTPSSAVARTMVAKAKEHAPGSHVVDAAEIT